MRFTRPREARTGFATISALTPATGASRPFHGRQRSRRLETAIERPRIASSEDPENGSGSVRPGSGVNGHRSTEHVRAGASSWRFVPVVARRGSAPATVGDRIFATAGPPAFQTDPSPERSALQSFQAVCRSPFPRARRLWVAVARSAPRERTTGRAALERVDSGGSRSGGATTETDPVRAIESGVSMRRHRSPSQEGTGGGSNCEADGAVRRDGPG